MSALSSEKENNRKFKFKELKVYSSTEWLADNKKKYRQVFDRFETSYVYVELSFLNKLFDQEDWQVNVELKCWAVKKNTKREMCHLSFDKMIKKYDSLVYVREGWGNKQVGAFWKKGTYYWEAYIDGELVSNKYFYIEDPGKYVNPSKKNPYLNIQSLRLYEGPFDDETPEEDRTYLTTFHHEKTRYIFAEIVLQNIFPGKNWQCELFTKFYNDARELKGQVVRLQKVEQKDELITITAGWGSNVEGSWRKDKYTCEIVFMNKLLAVIPFEVGKAEAEGINPVYMPDKSAPMIFLPEEDLHSTFEEVMVRMEDLTGLTQVKQQVKDHAKYINFVQLRKNKGFEEKDAMNVHAVFTGNPGTGKTTVAKMMGRLYQKMGLLTRGHVHEVDRSDLIGEYIGQTAPKVKAALDKARGGVLFIDEAYSLAREKSDNKDFGREVIEILVREMSNGKGDLAVIAAGYPKEMKNFLESNPGLKSRFKMIYDFDDYMPQELIEIAEYACITHEVRLSQPAKGRLSEIITEAYRNRDKTFGNARFVFDLIEKAKIQLGLRIMSDEAPDSLGKEFLEVIELPDVNKIDLKRDKITPTIPIDEDLLSDALSELNHLIGMRKIKVQINELVRLVRFYRETEKDVLNAFFLHTVFVGNPGTGKTTVARILTKIYKALGMLERGHMVETDRQGIVAGYVGQTAIKTAEKIDEAIGGVLFIDEAYALTQSGKSQRGDFGDEAIQTLLKRMEDQRGEFFVFVAGYPDNMETFLKANPGLNSRFDKILHFEDYLPSDLLEISMLMLQEKGLVTTPEAEERLKDYFIYTYDRRDKFFGNARTVRSIVDEAIKNQNLRLSAMPIEERNDLNINLLTAEDVMNFRFDEDSAVFNKKTIGFRARGTQN